MSEQPMSEQPDSELPESELPESELPESELPESELPDSELQEYEQPMPFTEIHDEAVINKRIDDFDAKSKKYHDELRELSMSVSDE